MKCRGFCVGLCLLPITFAPAEAQTLPPPVVIVPEFRPLTAGPPVVPPAPRVLTTLPDGSEYLPGNLVRPIFGFPGTSADHLGGLEAMIQRAIALGSVVPNTTRIADALDRGFIDPESPGYQAKKKAGDPGIRFAGGPGQIPNNNNPANNNGNNNPNDPNNVNNDGYRQAMEEINRLFKAQADLIRSIDIGSVRRDLPPVGSPGIANQDVVRVVLTGRTGLELGIVSPDVLDHFKIPRDQGLIVRHVFPDTPAEAAGYKKGDILLELNNRKVPSNFPDFLERIMGSVKINTPIPGIVLRGAERVQVGDMTVTDRRVIPALPNERLPDLSSVIRVVPGINSEQQNTNTVPEYRIIRNGLTTEIIPVYPNKK